MFDKKWLWLGFSLFLLLGSVGCGRNYAPSDNLDEVYVENIPRPILLHLEVAERYLIDGLVRESLAKLLKIQSQAQDYARFHFDLGMAYWALKQRPKAILEFERAVKINPVYGEAWNNLGLVYLQENKLDQARRCFQRALKILTYKTPELPALNLARVYLRQNKIDQAIAMAKASIDYNWRYGQAYLFLGKLLQEQGKLEQAQKILKQGVDANPNNPTLVLEYAKLLLKLGQGQEAKKWFKFLLSQDATSKEAQVARDYLDFLSQ